MISCRSWLNSTGCVERRRGGCGSRTPWEGCHRYDTRLIQNDEPTLALIGRQPTTRALFNGSELRSCGIVSYHILNTKIYNYTFMHTRVSDSFWCIWRPSPSSSLMCYNTSSWYPFVQHCMHIASICIIHQPIFSPESFVVTPSASQVTFLHLYVLQAIFILG